MRMMVCAVFVGLATALAVPTDVSAVPLATSPIGQAAGPHSAATPVLMMCKVHRWCEHGRCWVHRHCW